MDPAGQWWSDAELNEYIGAWQDALQEKFEFAWGTATVTTSTSTLTLTNIANDINRLDGIWWNKFRLAGRNKDELEVLIRDWRAAAASVPKVAYQDDIYSVSFFPAPATTGTAIFEYPRRVTFTTDTSTMSIPAWTKYSAVNYVVYRAHLRAGPNQDLPRAARRKAKFERQIKRYVTIHEQHFPDHAPSLRPGGRYEGDILTGGKASNLFQTWF